MPWKFGFPLKKLKKFCKFSLSPTLITPSHSFFLSLPLLKKYILNPPPFWPILIKFIPPPFKKGGFELCIYIQLFYFWPWASKCQPIILLWKSLGTNVCPQSPKKKLMTWHFKIRGCYVRTDTEYKTRRNIFTVFIWSCFFIVHILTYTNY